MERSSESVSLWVQHEDADYFIDVFQKASLKENR